MINYSAQVEGYGGSLRTTITIGNQTFTIKVDRLDSEDLKKMSQREYHQFFAERMQAALDNLVHSAKNDQQ